MCTSRNACIQQQKYTKNCIIPSIFIGLVTKLTYLAALTTTFVCNKYIIYNYNYTVKLTCLLAAHEHTDTVYSNKENNNQ